MIVLILIGIILNCWLMLVMFWITNDNIDKRRDEILKVITETENEILNEIRKGKDK